MNKTKPRTPVLLTALACAALSLSAQAGRPLQTEDAGVLERGDCELEGATQRVSVDRARATEHALQFGCGIGFRSQVALNASTAKDGGERSRGLALVGKTGLWTGAGDTPAGLTLAWALRWGKDDGQPHRHAGTGFNLVYSRPLPAYLTLHANLGHARDEQSRQRSTTWGLALEHAGFGPVAPMAEFFGDDREPAWWNLGLRWTVVPEKVFVDVSYGRQMSSVQPSLLTAGFKIAF